MYVPKNLIDATIDSVVATINQSPVCEEAKSKIIARVQMQDLKKVFARYIKNLHTLAPEGHAHWAFELSNVTMSYIEPTLVEHQVPRDTGRDLHKSFYRTFGGKE